MKIVFILRQPYPKGMACTQRIHLYAKGLQMHGNEVFIIIPRATESQRPNNTDLQGEYEGVKFKFSTKTTIQSKNKILRKISDIFGSINGFLIGLKERPNVIVLVSPLFAHAILFKGLSFFVRSKYLLERNEIPFLHKNQINLFYVIYLRMFFSLFDGIILITKELNSYLLNTLKINTKTCVVPILIDFKNSIKPRTNFHSNILVYSGSLKHRKDGVFTILEAFKMVFAKRKLLKLYITGDVAKSNDFKAVIDYIQHNQISDQIIFTGYLNENEYYQLLANADILLLAKSLNRQNQYNFPTKVGDYLASGSPVLITNVGEIKEFFEDGKSIFLCEPSADSMANKINYILDNFEDAIKIATIGRDVALTVFNYKTCIYKLNAFLNTQL